MGGKIVPGRGQRAQAMNVTPRVPHWWGKEVRGTKGVTVCSRCHAIYYDKHWHTWSNSATRLPDTHPVKTGLCSACTTLETKRGKSKKFGYEGELILSGLVEGNQKSELLHLIRNAGSRAVRRDPEDQIIGIEDKGSIVRVTTTENQLAATIGKQVHSAFKGGELNIRWSDEDLPVRVFWKNKE